MCHKNSVMLVIVVLVMFCMPESLFICVDGLDLFDVLFWVE